MSVRLDRAEGLRRAAGADHGVLATLHGRRGADLVPVCFAIVGQHLAIPIDRVKPKAAGELGRMRNLEADPRATLLVEHWDADDWSRLWWVRLELHHVEADGAVAADLERALRDGYAQYRDGPFETLMIFRIVGVTGWSASSPRLRPQHGPTPPRRR